MKSHNEIMQLLAAGFTREEILSMPDAEQTETSAEPTPKETTPAADPQHDYSEIIEKMNKTLDDLNQRIIDMQAANIINNMQPETQPHKMTAEEALSELIGPIGAK